MSANSVANGFAPPNATTKVTPNVAERRFAQNQTDFCTPFATTNGYKIYAYYWDRLLDLAV